MRCLAMCWPHFLAIPCYAQETPFPAHMENTRERIYLGAIFILSVFHLHILYCPCQRTGTSSKMSKLSFTKYAPQ